MENGRSTLTPNEINKFTYCPYQWYYERLYGRTELRRLAKERNEANSFEEREGNFERGRKYHDSVYLKIRFRNVLIKMIIVICVLLLLYFAFKEGTAWLGLLK